tara:strand:+ start:752 stop:1417 length:666 start_codon:yes stop_codon:yes gene_type:complete
MNSLNQNIAIVLTRKGSKRIKNKNSKPFYKDKSLLEILLVKLLEVNQFDRIISSSNCTQCLSLSKKYNVGIHIRSQINSSSTACSISALDEVLTSLDINSGNIFLFQCTSPFLSLHTISNFINFSNTQSTNSVVTTGHISKNDIWSIDSKRIFIGDPRRQQSRSGFYIENSAIYKIPFFQGTLNFDLNNFKFFQISEREGIDINTEEEWLHSQILFSHFNS